MTETEIRSYPTRHTDIGWMMCDDSAAFICLLCRRRLLLLVDGKLWCEQCGTAVPINKVVEESTHPEVFGVMSPESGTILIHLCGRLLKRLNLKGDDKKIFTCPCSSSKVFPSPFLLQCAPLRSGMSLP